jgi:hypothetical protein
MTKVSNIRRFDLLAHLARKGYLPRQWVPDLVKAKKAVTADDEAMLQGTCGGQRTLADAMDYHRRCHCPPVMVQVPEPMEEDPFEGLPTLVEGLCMEEDSDMPEDDLNLVECQPLWVDPMTELLKASVGPTLPDLANLFKGFSLPTTGAIKKQRRAKSPTKTCAVSA